MQHAFFLMLVTGVLWTVVGIVFGKAPGDRERLSTFFALNGVFCTLFIWGFHFPKAANPMEVLKLTGFMLPATVAEIIGFVLLKYAMARGSQGIAWSIVQSAMVLPFLGAIAFLHNPAGVLKYAGAAMMLVGLILVGLRQEQARLNEARQKKTFLLLSFGAFLLVGIGQFLRIIPGNAGFSEAALSWRLPIAASCSMLFWMCYVLKAHSFVPGKIWKLALFYGMITYLGLIFFFAAVDAADPLGITSVVYPIAVGTSILLFSCYCVFFRREKFSKIAWGGVASIVTGIALLCVD